MQILKQVSISKTIKPEDYIMMHKVEIESIAMNADILNWMAETSDKLGAVFLGFWMCLFSVPDHTQMEMWSFFSFGAFLTVSGVYYKCKRNGKINKIIKDKIKEAEDVGE